MRFSTTAAAVMATAATGALAQEYNQTAPFNLQITSENKTLDQLYLTACHSGAAIETLCTFQSSTPTPYILNYTETDTNAGSSGTLIFNLPLGGGSNGAPTLIPEPFFLSYDPNSNVAVGVFFPSQTQLTPVAFTDEGLLGLSRYYDDITLDYLPEPEIVTDRWYLCQQIYGGYRYTSLHWLVGATDVQPQNPSCQAVTVTRKAVA